MHARNSHSKLSTNFTNPHDAWTERPPCSSEIVRVCPLLRAARHQQHLITSLPIACGVWPPWRGVVPGPRVRIVYVHFFFHSTVPPLLACDWHTHTHTHIIVNLSSSTTLSQTYALHYNTPRVCVCAHICTWQHYYCCIFLQRNMFVNNTHVHAHKICARPHRLHGNDQLCGRRH